MSIPESSYTTAINILMVENQRVVGTSLRQAIAGLQIPHHLTICPGSAEALTHLRRDGSAATASYPDVIVLDAAVSESERHALLNAIHHDAPLRRFSVIVVTDSPGRNASTWVYYVPSQSITSQTLALLLRSTHAIDEFWNLLLTSFASEEEGAPVGRPGREKPGNVPSRDAAAKKR